MPVRGKEASSTFWVVARQAGIATLLGARLATGRTHQIRVHAAKLGHPVLGDSLYGRHPQDPQDESNSQDRLAPSMVQLTIRRPSRLALHAARLAFPHPATGLAVEVESPWPDELATWWALLDSGLDSGLDVGSEDLSTSRGPRSDPEQDPD